MKGGRRWLGYPVWVVDADGKTDNGTLWWVDETSVLIRRNGRVGLLTLPRPARRARSEQLRCQRLARWSTAVYSAARQPVSQVGLPVRVVDRRTEVP